MILSALMLPILLAGFPGAVPAAQLGTAQARDEFKPAEEVIATFPKTLFGTPALRTPGSPLVTYFGRIGVDPMAGLLAIESTTAPSVEEMRERARESYHESGLKAIVREGTFTSPLYPGAIGFFGEYNTRAGLKQNWTLETGRYRIHAGVTLFNGRDRKRAQAIISEQVFGGAKLAPLPSERR